MLTYCVTAAIGHGPHRDIRTLLAERVMRPIGVSDDDWSVGYDQTFTVDGLPLVGSWGGGAFTARAVARIGRLLLREGDWDGRRILSRDAVRAITSDAGLPGDCGMGWWTNAAGRYAKLPTDAVYGAGAGDQLLLVVPSLDLIVVRNGQTLVPPTPDAPDVFAAHHDPRAALLFEPLVAAVVDTDARAPYPPSPPSRGSTGRRRRPSSAPLKAATTGRSPGPTTTRCTRPTATATASSPSSHRS